MSVFMAPHAAHALIADLLCGHSQSGRQISISLPRMTDIQSTREIGVNMPKMCFSLAFCLHFLNIDISLIFQ